MVQAPDGGCGVRHESGSRRILWPPWPVKVVVDDEHLDAVKSVVLPASRPVSR